MAFFKPRQNPARKNTVTTMPTMVISAYMDSSCECGKWTRPHQVCARS
jgi:hypothetical protein